MLIHSNQKNANEVKAFCENYDMPLPLVIVPTTYNEFTEDQIREFPQIKMVIYANHVIRTCVKAVRESLSRIANDGGTSKLSNQIVETKELFELQKQYELDSFGAFFQERISDGNIIESRPN